MEIKDRMRDYDALVREGGGSLMYGTFLKDMSKDDLLAVIGYLGRERLAQQEFKDRMDRLVGRG